jgi:hypothetical protein
MAQVRRPPLPPMAITRAHSDETRQRIRAIKLVDRLQKFALSTDLDGKYIDEGGKEIKPMTPLQVKVSLALLNKVLPNLQTVEVNQEETRAYVIRAPAPSANMTEWLEQYAPKHLVAGSSE